MAAIPAGVDTTRQPPMTVPLRHFVVALGFLVIGAGYGVALAASGRLSLTTGTLAHVHLLLAGWVCITIMGAMTQFVPVWSGTDLHSERLASLQLWVVAVGVAGFAAAFALDAFAWLPVFGTLMLVAFWTFVYNVGRTLAHLDGLDVTERHFALALAFLLALTVLGVLLALDFTHPVFVALPVTHADALAAHATVAVFGVVLTTVFGALYQLATMFTQSARGALDDALQRVEEVAFPAGVVALAAGRLVGSVPLARVGGVLVVVGVLAFAGFLARRLLGKRVAWNPMLRRYAVSVPAFAVWAALAPPAWLADPLARPALFGAPGTVHLLAFGGVGFVVLGTLYHVVPFIVWVHRYSDRLGFERVPLVDDLYDSRVARADLVLLVAGALGLSAVPLGVPAWLVALAGAAATAGYVACAANLLGVVHRHGTTLAETLLGRRVWLTERGGG